MCCSNKHELKLYKSSVVRSCNLPSDTLYRSVKVKYYYYNNNNNNNNNNNAVFFAVTLCLSLLDGYQIFRVKTVSIHTDLLPATCTRFTPITQRSYMVFHMFWPYSESYEFGRHVQRIWQLIVDNWQTIYICARVCVCVRAQIYIHRVAQKNIYTLYSSISLE